MKNLFLFAVTFMFLSISNLADAQSNEKATVYIVRTDFSGGLINFKVFVGDQFVGKFNHGKYLKLELDPGEHLIWATSENRSFVKAKVEAGKTYAINALPVSGAFKVAVKLFPLEDMESAGLRRAKKYVNKFKEKQMTNEEIAIDQKKFAEIIKLGLAKYEKIKSKPRVRILENAVDWENIPLKRSKS